MVSPVLAGFLFVLPMLMGLLGVLALRRDRLSAGVMLAVLAGFAVYAIYLAIGPHLPEPGPRLDPKFLGLWLAAASGLAVRLVRDRRRRHVRSTLESLLVLGSGAILLAMLLSLPGIMAELARAGAV